MKTKGVFCGLMVGLLLAFTLGHASPSHGQTPGGFVLQFHRVTNAAGGFVALPFIPKPAAITISAWVKPNAFFPSSAATIFGWAQSGNPFTDFRITDTGLLSFVELNKHRLLAVMKNVIDLVK